MLSQYQISDQLLVDFDKYIIGIGKYQNSHIGTPLMLVKEHKGDTAAISCSFDGRKGFSSCTLARVTRYVK